MLDVIARIRNLQSASPLTVLQPLVALSKQNPENRRRADPSCCTLLAVSRGVGA
jgi:hypothetical protein